MQSISNAPHTLASVLQATEQFLGENREWTFVSAGDQLKNILPELQKQLPELAEILESKAQRGGVDEVNSFLQERGFSLKVRDLGRPYDVYAASVLSVKVLWEKPGEVVKITLEASGTEVDAVEFKSIAGISMAAGHTFPVVIIKTSTPWSVFMTKYDKPVADDSTSVYDTVMKLSASMEPATGYSGVRFPMVDFERSGSIQELAGARTTAESGDQVTIAEALFQHRLRMNEFGAKAEAAAVTGVLGAVLRPQGEPVVIDGPFLFWMEKDDVVGFCAYISEEHMKRPANLDKGD